MMNQLLVFEHHRECTKYLQISLPTVEMRYKVSLLRMMGRVRVADPGHPPRRSPSAKASLAVR